MQPLVSPQAETGNKEGARLVEPQGARVAGEAPANITRVVPRLPKPSLLGARLVQPPLALETGVVAPEPKGMPLATDRRWFRPE